MSSNPIDPATVEKNKDRLNLRPSLEFVERHIDVYERNFDKFMERQEIELPAHLRNIDFLNTDKVDETEEPQVRVGDVKEILSRLPETFLNLSLLKAVDYKFNQLIPVPIFEADGTWNRGAHFVPVDEFPRTGDHPTRILIGYSDGYTIYPSALPKQVSSNDKARWFYQLHVFLHEFFHTIEYRRRSPECRSKIIINHVISGRDTLQQWWNEQEFYCKIKLPAKQKCPSIYSELYVEDLTADAFTNDYDRFTRAFAEQICESFVGYVLGLVPNSLDSTDFRRQTLLTEGSWDSMDWLASASGVQFLDEVEQVKVIPRIIR